VLADAKILYEFDLKLNTIGRVVLRDNLSDHISNRSIYEKLRLAPVSEILNMRLLLFWSDIVHSKIRPRLKNFALRIFSNDRKTGFWPESHMNVIHKKIFNACSLY